MFISCNILMGRVFAYVPRCSVTTKLLFTLKVKCPELRIIRKKLIIIINDTKIEFQFGENRFGTTMVPFGTYIIFQERFRPWTVGTLCIDNITVISRIPICVQCMQRCGLPVITQTILSVSCRYNGSVKSTYNSLSVWVVSVSKTAPLQTDVY